MKTESEVKLAAMIRDAGLSALLDRGGGEDEKLHRWNESLTRAYETYAERYGAASSVVPALSEENLLRERTRNPHRLKAFLQALGWEPGSDMLVMAWRILQGDKINTVEMRYHQAKSFQLEVTLRDQGSSHISSYESNDIDDAALLRHFGIAKKGGQPFFDGFHPTPSK